MKKQWLPIIGVYFAVKAHKANQPNIMKSHFGISGFYHALFAYLLIFGLITLLKHLL